MTEHRASLFLNGRDQAVRTPREFEMEGTHVLMRKDGDRLNLTPVRGNCLLLTCPGNFVPFISGGWPGLRVED